MSRTKRRLKKKYKDGVIAFFNVFIIGILWTITSMFVVTMGASSAAAYYVFSRKLGKERNVISPFFESLKDNLLVSFPLQLGYMLFGAWLFFDIYVLLGYGTKSATILGYVVIFITIITAAVYMYQWPVISRFDAKRRRMFKLALVGTFRHLLVTMCFMALVIIFAAAVYYVPVVAVFLPGPVLFAKAILIRGILDEFSGREIVAEVEEEDDFDEKESLVVKRRIKTTQKSFDDTDDDDDGFRDRVIKK